jgi:hypothetical protein
VHFERADLQTPFRRTTSAAVCGTSRLSTRLDFTPPETDKPETQILSGYILPRSKNSLEKVPQIPRKRHLAGPLFCRLLENPVFRAP